MPFMFKFVSKTYKITMHCVLILSALSLLLKLIRFLCVLKLSILTITGPEEQSLVETSGSLIHNIISAELQEIEFKI